MIETPKSAEMPPSAVRPRATAETGTLYHAKEAWSGLTEVAHAELEIFTMKAARVGALALIGSVVGAILLGFGIYGLVLLNQTLDIALSGPETPDWVSPLVRGVIYVACPAITLFLMWHALIGWGGASREEQAIDTQNKKKEEARHGARV